MVYADISLLVHVQSQPANLQREPWPSSMFVPNGAGLLSQQRHSGHTWMSSIANGGGRLENEPSSPLNRMWLKYGGNTPLSLQVTQEASADEYTDGELKNFTTHFHRIRSLGLHTGRHFRALSIIEYWAHNGGVPGALHTLTLAKREKFKQFLTHRDVGYGIGILSAKHFLSGLQVLCVRGILIDMTWLYGYCPPLVHLELIELASSRRHPVGLMSVINHVLRACPGLQVLMLESLADLDRDLVETLGDPILLSEMKRLELINISPQACSVLLESIYPVSGC
ncbi:hypothetical protein RhiJN_02407 [Ceratobasidium sp. AG-Ba]|nr:hypothetical protein RhiJN_02407 [Ceratobasidium sp. AG-Ba]